MDVALKEWALVCELLVRGEQIALVRKGGIHEPLRGAFTPDHAAFLLYPNAAHQSADLVQPRFRRALMHGTASPREEGDLRVPGYCRVSDVVPLSDAAAHALAAHTCWTDAFFAQRLAYKAERPLLLLLVRAFRFSEPLRLPYHRAYAGCRSWVRLRDAAPPHLLVEAEAALDDAAYQEQRSAVLSVLA